MNLTYVGLTVHHRGGVGDMPVALFPVVPVPIARGLPCRNWWSCSAGVWAGGGFDGSYRSLEGERRLPISIDHSLSITTESPHSQCRLGSVVAGLLAAYLALLPSVVSAQGDSAAYRYWQLAAGRRVHQSRITSRATESAFESRFCRSHLASLSTTAFWCGIRRMADQLQSPSRP